MLWASGSIDVLACLDLAASVGQCTAANWVLQPRLICVAGRAVSLSAAVLWQPGQLQAPLSHTVSMLLCKPADK